MWSCSVWVRSEEADKKEGAGGFFTQLFDQNAVHPVGNGIIEVARSLSMVAYSTLFVQIAQ
jgi:hypothetical protein